MRGLWLLPASAAISLMLLLLPFAPVRAATAKTVVIKQMQFQPSQLSVEPGDTITWKNEDIFTHTVTSDDGSFDSGPIEPGKSWTTTITKAGTLGYHCRPHPNMKAAVVVGGDDDHEHEASGHHAEHGSGSLAFKPPTGPQELHPILVNFTAALVPMALLSDLLGLFLRRRSLHDAGSWMMLYAAAITPLTVVAGWWGKLAGDSDVHGRLIIVHQWLGTFAAVLFIGLAMWRWSLYKRDLPPNVSYLVAALIAVLALVYQGSLGGSMVFGR
jgi:plastocyanin/uncharacterized membrane protein